MAEDIFKPIVGHWTEVPAVASLEPRNQPARSPGPHAITALFVQLWDRASGEGRSWVAWAPDRETASQVASAFHEYIAADAKTISHWLRKNHYMHSYHAYVEERMPEEAYASALPTGIAETDAHSLPQQGDTPEWQAHLGAFLRAAGARHLYATFFPHHQITGSVAILAPDETPSDRITGIYDLGAILFARLAVQVEARVVTALLGHLGIVVGGNDPSNQQARVQPLLRALHQLQEAALAGTAAALNEVARSAAHAAKEARHDPRFALVQPTDRTADQAKAWLEGLKTGDGKLDPTLAGALRVCLEAAFRNVVLWAPTFNDVDFNAATAPDEVTVTVRSPLPTGIAVWPDERRELAEALEEREQDLASGWMILEQVGVGTLCLHRAKELLVSSGWVVQILVGPHEGKYEFSLVAKRRSNGV